MKLRTFIWVTVFIFSALISYGQTTLQNLLEELAIPYTKDKMDKMTFTLSDVDGDVQIFAEEKEIQLKNPTRFIYMYTVLVPGSGKENPPALFRQIAFWNERLIFGKIGVGENDGGVFYCTSLYLGSNLNSNFFLNELILTYRNTINYRKEIRPFLHE